MATFNAAFDRKGLGLLIDVREPGEYAVGYIPGAVNLPRGMVELRIWSYVGYPGNSHLARKITLYCGTGMRCVLAAKSQIDRAFSNVTAVDMRLDDWARAGYPLLTK